MPSNPQLLYALLSMDAYHRGDEGGLVGEVPQTQIDGTTRLRSSPDNNIGFSAQSYTYDGATIIAYRGTGDGSTNDCQSLLGIPSKAHVPSLRTGQSGVVHA